MTELTESEFVGLLYDAALSRTTWTSVAEALSQLLDCSSAFVGDPQQVSSEIAGTHRIPPRFMDQYRAEFFKHDPWVMGVSRA